MLLARRGTLARRGEGGGDPGGDPGGGAWYEGGSPDPPVEPGEVSNYFGNRILTEPEGPTEAGVIEFYTEAPEGNIHPTPLYWGKSLDLTAVSELRVYTRGDALSSWRRVIVRIDGSDVLNTDSNHVWTERVFDVSGESGLTLVELGMRSDATTQTDFEEDPAGAFSDMRPAN